MRKWISYFCPLIMIVLFTNFGHKSSYTLEVPEFLKVKEPTVVSYPNYEAAPIANDVRPPYLGTSYIGFKEALAFKESQGNYFVTNTLGYLGKYQFGIGTLQLMGVYNASRFLNDPMLQERVFTANIARNKWILRKDIEWFVGERINGVEITESGILAAAHLAGAGNVKKYLRSYGKFDIQDAYGTSLSDYMQKFSGYDVSKVLAKRKVRL